MSSYESRLQRITALCIGTAALAFGAPPAGVSETSVGLAGLVGAVLDRSKTFGPENARVRKRIQTALLRDYDDFIASDGDSLQLKDELQAADLALQETLESSFLDRDRLVAAAVTPEGFSNKAIAVIMECLSNVRGDLFGADKHDTLAYRYARSVVQEGIQEAVQNVDYYRQLEPKLMFEMARSLGDIQKKLDTALVTHKRELDAIKAKYHATENELTKLLTFILQRRVSPENIIRELEQSYEKLTELRRDMAELKSVSNEAPEIAPLLEQADSALTAGEKFSLDEAASALATARTRYLEIVAERDEQVKRDKENVAQILGKEAQIAAVKFDYAAASDFSQQQLALLIEVLGEEHPATAASYNNVAVSLNDQGRLSEASPFFRKALDIRKLVFGEEHLDTATSYNNVACNLSAQGYFIEAEPLFRTALGIRKRILGEEKSDTAGSYNNVASNLNAQGRLSEAEPLFRKALGIRERILGEEHPDTATSYNNVASNLNAQGRLSEAEPLFRKALEIRERVLGEEHPLTATSYNNVATNLNDRGRLSEAEPLFRKALEISERILGEEHPDTAARYNNVAYNLNAQGRLLEAEPLLRKALEIRERILGEEHPETAASYNNVATNLNALGRLSEAEPLFRKALEITKQILGEEHPDVAWSYNNVAANLSAQGRLSEAEPLFRKALGIRERILGERHPDTAASHNNVASNLNAQGRLWEAEPLLRKALEVMELVLGEDHPNTSLVRRNLADVNEQLKDARKDE